MRGVDDVGAEELWICLRAHTILVRYGLIRNYKKSSLSFYSPKSCVEIYVLCIFAQL